MTWIDLTVPLVTGMTAWPGSPGLRLSRYLDIAAGDAVNNSRLDTDVHVGTHVDAPLHHLPDGADAASLPLSALVGPAVVAQVGPAEAVGDTELEALDLPAGTERLLLRTRNSAHRPTPMAPFREDFVALTPAAARWLVARRIRLVGVDGPSVQRFADPPDTHRILLAAGVVVLEGLDLAAAAPGRYELLCLPLKLVGSDGAPARAVLRPLP